MTYKYRLIGDQTVGVLHIKEGFQYFHYGGTSIKSDKDSDRISSTKNQLSSIIFRRFDMTQTLYVEG